MTQNISSAPDTVPNSWDTKNKSRGLDAAENGSMNMEVHEASTYI